MASGQKILRGMLLNDGFSKVNSAILFFCCYGLRYMKYRRCFMLCRCAQMLRLESANENRRIDARIIQADVPVHVRSGGAAG